MKITTNITAIIFCLLMTSCVNDKFSIPDRYCGKYIVYQTGEWGRTTFVADSARMVNNAKADVWVGGNKSTLFAKEIFIVHKPCN